MTTFTRALTLPSAGLLAGLLAWLPAAPAQALNPKSFVSSTGSGTSCTFALPCGSFQSAHDATNDKGQIACLDSGDFGGAVISKSITIDCSGTSATSSEGFIVLSSGIVVTIRNLVMATRFGVGIDFQTGAALFVENATFTGLPTGIVFRPSAPGSQLVVTDTVLKNNGGGSNGGGIIVQPFGSGSAKVTLDRVHVDKNSTGVFFNAASGQTIQAVIKNGTVSGNAFTGVYALAGGGIIRTTIERSTINNNGGTGVLSQGANAFVTVTGSTITANNTGWTFSGGGNLITYLDNKVSLNLASDGAPSASLGSQ
jgi:hypothetical protein